MFLSGTRDDQQHQLDVLLQGYSEFHSFNTAELRLIEPLRTLRIMHYAAWLTRRFGGSCLSARISLVRRESLLGRTYFESA